MVLAVWLTVVTKAQRLAQFYGWLRQRLIDLSGTKNFYVPWGLMDCADDEVSAFCSAFCGGRTVPQYKTEVEVGSRSGA